MRYIYFILIIFITGISACGNDYSPKPRGYFRIKLPKKAYQKYDSNCPYTFEYPIYSTVMRARDGQPCFIDVSFPQFNGRIHLSYQPITSKKVFNELVEDARSFAFKHTVKATAIDEGAISYPEKQVYGVYYSIEGNTASAAQFYLTDSTRHYLRGALYFDEEPRRDSLQPVLDFIKKDIDIMIKSFNWK
jgi:gliding motility-associated lipoprotein GldD